MGKNSFLNYRAKDHKPYQSTEGADAKGDREHFLELKIGRLRFVVQALVEDIEKVNSDSHSQDNRESKDCPIKCKFTLQNAILDTTEKDEGNCTRNQRRCNPRNEDLLRNLPVDGIEALGANGESHDATDNGMGGRDWEGKVSSSKQHEGSNNKRCHHAQHDNFRNVSIELGGENL